MATIDLDRQFLEWEEGPHSDPELVHRFQLTQKHLNWEALLKRRRVVILAEAGGGKSTEMKAQTQKLQEAGKFAVYASVQDVGSDGIENALSPSDQQRLAAWRTAGDEGWFFIDSVDEAKRGNVRLEKAIRRIAQGISGAERRAHVVLSGRITDWEFQRDLQHLSEGIPIPPDSDLPPPPTGDELLVKILRHEKPSSATPVVEKPIVVLMGPLDQARIKSFAGAQKIDGLDGFLAEIEAADLWHFARRPLDLSWLVSFWQEHKRLGSLAEMLEDSLATRVREANLVHARSDGLEETRALHAIERIGAALVFGKKETIAIPDSDGSLSGKEQPLILDHVLSDWPANQRSHLLTRPVFDPATLGRIRLHSDNDGVVRSFLTARWLHRLRQENLSFGQLAELLFASTYGIELVIPSLRETATWLSIWDEEVRREVLRRDPFLLIAGGDAASLPSSLRKDVLCAVVGQLADGREPRYSLSRDSVQRFATPDLCDTVRRLWETHRETSSARHLLLRIIWLGKLSDCLDLAEASAYGTYSDEYTQRVAARCIGAVGDDKAKRRYVTYTKKNCASLLLGLIRDTIDDFFSSFLDVSGLLHILTSVDVRQREREFGFEWLGPQLVERLSRRADLEQMLDGLLNRMGRGPVEVGHIPSAHEEMYSATIAATACRLLDLCPPDETPVDVIDAAIELGRRFHHSRSTKERAELGTALHRYPARRRAGFWRAAEQLRGEPILHGRAIEVPWQMDALGYSPGLEMIDVEWLLTDGPQRGNADERMLAINTAMILWRENGRADELVGRIRRAAGADTALLDAIDRWVTPPPRSPEELKHDEEISRIRREAEARSDERDKSWKEFAKSLRDDPAQLRKLPPATPEGVDGRFVALWDLLYQVVGSNTRYAIDSVAPLEPIIGKEASAAFRDALIVHWRHWKPTVRSERRPEDQNKMSKLDCMGIAGVTLKAQEGVRWGERLTAEEARRATCYATIEINGFPEWLTTLALAKPTEVRAVLTGEAAFDLATRKGQEIHGILDDIARADGPIVDLVAPDLLKYLQMSGDPPIRALKPALEIITKSVKVELDKFVEWSLSRFEQASEIESGAMYLGATFSVDPTAATQALDAKLRSSTPGTQKSLVELVLPSIFGNAFGPPMNPIVIEISDLERLMRIAYGKVRVEEDNQRPSGKTYSPDDRDRAEQARSAAFDRLIKTPGRAAYDALLRLRSVAGFPVPEQRLVELAHQRAAEDSEAMPWRAEDTKAFEDSAETAPMSCKDLQRVAVRRFADMQHGLLHSDFAQGTTVQSLPDERSVQKWVADRLRLKQGRSYSVEREAHVVDEKEPDIRLRAKASDASIAIEVKIPESWTIEELETALLEQLCGQYLRARDARYGILLLVHQKAKRWRDPQTRKRIGFDDVVSRLNALAADVSGKGLEAPQPEVVVIDVSGVAPRAVRKISGSRRVRSG